MSNSAPYGYYEVFQNYSGGSVSNTIQVGTLVSNTVNVEVGVFTTRNKPAKKITAVKLTKSNRDAVAERIRKALDEKVTVDDETIAVGDIWVHPEGKKLYGQGCGTFRVGQWIVEHFDYRTEKVRFRVATLDERETFDLR